MLKATAFDLKTGQALTEYDTDALPAGGRRIRQQEIEYCYLEHWLTHHGLEAPLLFVAEFYRGVDEADQVRLAAEDKVLFCTNGAKGYFTDRATAALFASGDPSRGIEPLYAADQHYAHNAVAYGSLLVSDGKASVGLTPQNNLPIRVLVVDDERRQVGAEPLIALDTELPLSDSELGQLLDRMGDGTMLVSASVLQQLVTEADVTQFLTSRLSERSEQIEPATQHYLAQGSFTGIALSAAQAQELDEQFTKRLQNQVVQFRAATPDLPGMAKGTLTYSDWADRLGVEAIISANDIKGDDGRLSRPGIHEFDSFWINRKSDARHSQQVVGPQVKGTIPNATQTELNPEALQRLAALNEAAADPALLVQAYVKAQREKREQGTREETPGTAEPLSEGGKAPRPDWLATVLEADPYGTLHAFPSVVDSLERWLRGERLEIALSGNRIPSATAQHHAQLKPWEICHSALPPGALVAFYRSPFPNAGAAAIAINNPDALSTLDSEAFKKQGVLYLNPWTAKHVAITDFDGDANGCFVGFHDLNNGQLAQQLREELSPLAGASPEVQYEAARTRFFQLIAQQAQDPGQSPLRPADYPKVVSEFIALNAPGVKPPPIAKQAKLKHSWNPEQERLDQAIWRAWQITADNPIGRVANGGIILQSFANECAFQTEDREALMVSISQAYGKVLKSVDQGRLSLPSDDDLQAQGLPPLQLAPRLEAVAAAASQLPHLSGESRQALVEQTLADTHDLLTGVVNGPVAQNLQTAVDIAKSSRGIDEGFYQLARALQYKDHALRRDRKNPQVYTGDRVLEINTDEPTAWVADAVNQSYGVVQLPREGQKIAASFGPLMPNPPAEPGQVQTAQQLCTHYYGLTHDLVQATRQLREAGRAAQQPSLTLTSNLTGHSLQVERLTDALAGQPFDWRIQGPTDWQVEIRREPNDNSFVVERIQAGEQQRLGWVSANQAREGGLEQAMEGKACLHMANPMVQLKPPLALENPIDELRARPQRYLGQMAQDLQPGERAALAVALWQTNMDRGPERARARMGMNLAMRMFPEEVAQQLAEHPLRLHVSDYPNRAATPPPGPFLAQVERVMVPNAAGELVERNELLWKQPDGTKAKLGLLAQGGVQVSPGLEVTASIQESLQQAATLQATIPGGAVTVTQVTQFDFPQRAFEAEAATLKLCKTPNGSIHVLRLDGTEPPPVLGRLEADTRAGREQARRFWSSQQEQPWLSQLARKDYLKVEWVIEGSQGIASPRSFDQAARQRQQGTEFSPSYQELQVGWQVAHAQQQPKVMTELKLMGDALVLAWQQAGHVAPPPANFRSATVRVDPVQWGQMHQAREWLQQQQPSYAPKYQELQTLWRLAEPGAQQGRLAVLGQKLVSAFQYESGSQAKPGPDYQCADVRLSLAERERIYQAQQKPSSAVLKPISSGLGR